MDRMAGAGLRSRVLRFGKNQQSAPETREIRSVPRLHRKQGIPRIAHRQVFVASAAQLGLKGCRPRMNCSSHLFSRARAVFAICLAIAAGQSLHAELSPQERAIADWALGHEADMVTLLERAVRVDSPTENLAGVRAVGDLFGDELKASGVMPRWIPLPAEMNRSGHLWAEHGGGQGKRLLLIGHLDTVLHGGRFTSDGPTGRGSG